MEMEKEMETENGWLRLWTPYKAHKADKLPT